MTKKEQRAMAHDIVANRRPMLLIRNGRTVKAVPTMAEARRVVADMQRFLDIANGEVCDPSLSQEDANRALECIATKGPH